MSKLRLVLVVLAVLLAAAAGAGWWFFSRLGALVEKEIERQVSTQTGTAVDASGVRVSLRSGEGSIGRLTIANPAGFSRRDALTLERARIVLDLGTVTKPVVTVNEISFARAEALYELDAKGKANLDGFRKGTTAPAPEASEAPRLIVKRFEVLEGHVTVDAEALGKGTETLELNPVRLSNVGAPNGAPAEQVSRRIVTALGKEVARAATARVFWRTLEQKTGGISERLKDIVR